MLITCSNFTICVFDIQILVQNARMQIVKLESFIPPASVSLNILEENAQLQIVELESRPPEAQFWLRCSQKTHTSESLGQELFSDP